MRQTSSYDQEVPDFEPPSCADQSLTCDLLVAGGGLSGLSAAEAGMRRGLDVVLIEKGAFGKEAASGLNAGQFLTGWAKPVDLMVSDLTRQELRRGLTDDQAQVRAQRRVRAFLRRTVEGCQRLAQLDHDYNLRASVRHGAVTAAMNDSDMARVRADYEFMEKGNFRALMPLVGRRRPPFFRVLSARRLPEPLWHRPRPLCRWRDRSFRRQLSPTQVPHRTDASAAETGRALLSSYGRAGARPPRSPDNRVLRKRRQHSSRHAVHGECLRPAYQRRCARARDL